MPQKETKTKYCNHFPFSCKFPSILSFYILNDNLWLFYMWLANAACTMLDIYHACIKLSFGYLTWFYVRLLWKLDNVAWFFIFHAWCFLFLLKFYWIILKKLRRTCLAVKIIHFEVWILRRIICCLLYRCVMAVFFLINLWIQAGDITGWLYLLYRVNSVFSRYIFSFLMDIGYFRCWFPCVFVYTLEL